MQRLSLGRAGERVAERELERLGMRIVARNVRSRYGEIDLVARERAGYVFVEVKTRRASSFVAALESVPPAKARRLAFLAEGWLATRGERAASWRLVLAALTVSPDGTRVDLVPLEL